MRAVVMQPVTVMLNLRGKLVNSRLPLRADDNAIQFVHDRRGIKQFMGCQTGEGAAIDIANVVDACLSVRRSTPAASPRFRARCRE